MSLGGYYAPRAAAFEKRVKACIALVRPVRLSRLLGPAPGTHPRDVPRRSHCADEAAAERNAATLSLKDVANSITCPLCIVAGRQDRLVPWQDAERLAREASGPVELMLIADGNHVANNRGYRWRLQTADWMADRLARELAAPLCAMAA